MKIARFILDEKEQYGIIKGGEVFQTNITRDDMGIESFLRGEVIQGGKLTRVNDEGITWLSPIARPGKIMCVGRNYSAHAKESGMSAEKKPLLFSKYSTSLVGHMAEVTYPDHTENLDYEVELAVIIGKTASKLVDEDPFDYVFGYSIANDITARDVQKSDKTWTRGKAFDQSLPLGPYIISRDEVDPMDQEIWLTVNGDKRQLSSTNLMIFDIAFLIKYISQVITLEPGDIILTGTPEGVGFYMEPKATLQKGDFVSCGVTNVGELRFSIK